MKITFASTVNNSTFLSLILLVFFLIPCNANENYKVNISLPKNKSVDSVLLADQNLNLLALQKVDNTFYLDKSQVVKSDCKNYFLLIYVSNRIYSCDNFMFPLTKDEIDVEITSIRKLSKYLGYFFFTFSVDYGSNHKFCFYTQNRPLIEQISSNRKPR